MIDMGEKERRDLGITSSNGKKVSYQTFSIRGDKIPQELQDAVNGAKCRLEIIVRKVGDTIDTYTDEEPRRVELEIRGLGYIGKAGKISKEEYLAKTEDERTDYDKKQMEDESKEDGDEEGEE
jgi:hypothetical protein